MESQKCRCSYSALACPHAQHRWCPVPSPLESFVAFNAQKVCPKCGLAWFPRLNSQWHPDAAQSIERDCPEAEHLHVQCPGCAFSSYFVPADGSATTDLDVRNGWLS